MPRAIATRVTLALLAIVTIAPARFAVARPPSNPPAGPPTRRATGNSGISPVTPASTPHPSVVRIIVKESDGESMGSGSLIDIRDPFGLVITNWHVIRDAAGDINVVFPDGFKSAARIVKADRDWDLAALSIWRPPVKPLTIASIAPQPGDVLSIAGYGPTGDYRLATGRCTQYMAPSEKHPFEIVELSAEARQGDSGGPILNERGELAGVLFGSADGATSGSYAGRLQEFLGTLVGGEGQGSTADANLANGNKPPITVPPLLGRNDETTVEQAAQHAAVESTPVAANKPTAKPARKQVAVADAVLEPIEPFDDEGPASRGPRHLAASEDGSLDKAAYVADDPPNLPRGRAGRGNIDWIALLGETPFDQAKSALAAVGIIAIVMRAMSLGRSG